MKNYLVIFGVLGLIGVFAVGYVLSCFYISFNLERNPKKLSQKFRNMDIMSFPVVLLGFFPILGILMMLKINFSFSFFFLLFFGYYFLAFAYKIFTLWQLSCLQRHERLDRKIRVLKKIYQESTDRFGQKDKISKVIWKLRDKQLETKSCYCFWTRILTRECGR